MEIHQALEGWVTEVAARDGARHRAIVDALAIAVESGALDRGSRLPPQRVLAEALGVDLTTVSRAMAEAQRRGLVVTRGRNGSFIAAAPLESATMNGVVCDLSVNYPAYLDAGLAARLRDVMAAAASSIDTSALLDYPRAGWGGRHAVAGARWCAHVGMQAPEECIALTGGALQALVGVTAMLCEPGSTIVAAGLTYPGLLALARRMGVRVVGVDMDAEGIEPDALAEACARTAPSFVYLVPTFHNPTTATASPARRRRIAEVIARSGTHLVEDDGHAALLERRVAPVASLIPERSYYVAGLSKCVSPGLRTAYVATPSQADAQRLATVLVSLGQFPAPLVAEASTDVVLGGLAMDAARCMQRNAAERWTLAHELLPELQSGVAQTNHFGWLPVPSRWRGESFGERARSLGVRVSPAGSFAVAPRFVTSAVRVCLGAATSLPQLASALRTLRAVLREDAASVRPAH